MYDGGKMDGANLVGCSPDANCPPNAHPNPQFMYVNPSDVQPYFALAEQYTFADRMFQTNQGPSFPAHQFIISGTSAPCSQALPCPGAGSNLFAAENPKTSDPPDAGCDAPVGSTVSLIDPTGVITRPVFRHQHRLYTRPRRSGTARKLSSISADLTRRRPTPPPAWERIGPTMWSLIRPRYSTTFPTIN
jgi:hypothetical protein